jgi:hypothetical protein
MKRNNLNTELVLAKKLGFEATSKNSRSRNPYMRLIDGSCLVWLAGGLLSLVTTETFFGTHQNLKCWKSSSGNSAYATMSTTQLNSSGIGMHTEIYYREIYQTEIIALARRYGVLESEIFIDHINHIRGDNRDCNLRVATAGQNNQNKSDMKIEKAFYTIEDLKEKLASGEWVPLASIC